MPSCDIEDICYHKEIHVENTYFCNRQKFRKGISQITKSFSLTFYFIVFFFFGATRIQINAFLSGSGYEQGNLSGSGSGSGAGIEVDPDPWRYMSAQHLPRET